ncbi:beta-propeller domain-containing protein [Streptosporangium longisporum]|uniref:Benzoate transporter n=1 Tax=Streptosporangium longisporum TaxID=46187 RepID=A0ABN3XU39_9ACTN
MRTSTRTAGTVGAVTLAAALLATACTQTGTGGAPGTRTATQGTVKLPPVTLVAYDGCDDMLAGLRASTAGNVGPWGLGGPSILYATARDSAASAKSGGEAPEHSTTNVHEAGVDEPDLVKTDGKRVITVNRGVLRVVDTATRKVTGTLRLVNPEMWAPADLLVSGDRALVLFSGGGIVPFGATSKRAAIGGPHYALVDLSGKPKVIGSLTPEGSHVDARMVGSTVRIVVRNQPRIEFPDHGDVSEAERTRRNAEIVAKAPIEAWLPRYELAPTGGTASKRTVGCERISHPAKYTGTSMLSVHTLDLAGTLTDTAPISVVADGDTVYGTGSSLYVTSNPGWWSPRPIDSVIVDDAPATPAATPTASSPPPASPAPPAVSTATPGTTAPDAPAAPGAVPGLDPQPSLLPEPAPDASTASPEPAPSAPVTSPVPAEPPAVTPGTATPVVSSPATGTPSAEPVEPPEETEIHRFDVTAPGAPRYVASGRVPGRLLNQYSLSEHEGHLRVATTLTLPARPVSPSAGPSAGSSASPSADLSADPSTAPAPDPAVDPAVEPRGVPNTSSSVHVLKADTLVKTGEVGGLGRGERIYSVRFIGPLGYVVTFRQVDPLYTLDLRDPAAPRATGELKITGYSAYLHPAGEGRLIGVGQEASEQGRTLGTQVSLFDVGDPAAPRRLSQMFQKDSGSEAEWDPHAFLYWPKTGTAVIPLSSWTGSEPTTGAAVVLDIGDTEITKVGTIQHSARKRANNTRLAAYDPGIRRSVVIGDELWTVSDLGLKINTLDGLAERAWIPFS